MTTMAEGTKSPSFFSAAGGFFGRVLLPLGLFSVLVVGLHVGSDRIDDHLFELFSLLDAGFDAAVIFLIREGGALVGLDARTISEWTYRAIELIDADEKTQMARTGALVVELAADFVLALPVFVHRREGTNILLLRDQARRIFRDPTLLKLSLPVAVLAAGLGGTISICREIQVLVHARIAHWSLAPEVLNFLPAAAGFTALALVSWRILFPLLVGAIDYADRRANDDRQAVVPVKKRRLRGLVTTFVALPVALVALFATPVLGTVRALLWM